jgi:hypothetical protein
MITIRRIGVFSLAKLFAVVSGGFGLVGGLLLSGFVFLGIVFGESYTSTTEIGMMCGLIFVLPILYAILGLIGGFITALLVNLALRFGGGLEVYAEIKKQPAIAPAAPQVVVGKQKH